MTSLIFNLKKYKRIHNQIFNQCRSFGSKTVRLEKISGRGFLRVSGVDSSNFLQGLITNDINHIKTGVPAIFTLFLNKSGRILYDAIIYPANNNYETYLIDCDINLVNELKKHLEIFKVRRKVEIEIVTDEYSVSTLDLDKLDLRSKVISLLKENIVESIACQDPRLSKLGIRIIIPNRVSNSKIVDLLNKYNLQLSNSLGKYQQLRYILGVGEGINDLPPGKSFALEANGDYLHGISFQKGCYLGQELTARTYHTGVVRKRIMPFKLLEEKKIQSNEIKDHTGKTVAIIRGINNIFGIALTRIENALKAEILKIDDVECNIYRPLWWPEELPLKLEAKSKKIA